MTNPDENKPEYTESAPAKGDAAPPAEGEAKEPEEKPAKSEA